MAMTVDDFLLEFGIHFDGTKSDKNSGEEYLEGGTARWRGALRGWFK